MFTRARPIWAGFLAAATTAALVGAPAMVHTPASRSTRSTEELTMGRLRLLWAALFAAMATAAIIATPAVLAGITFNGLD